MKIDRVKQMCNVKVNNRATAPCQRELCRTCANVIENLNPYDLIDSLKEHSSEVCSTLSLDLIKSICVYSNAYTDKCVVELCFYCTTSQTPLFVLDYCEIKFELQVANDDYDFELVDSSIEFKNHGLYYRNKYFVEK